MPTRPSILARMLAPIRRALEGAYRPGPYPLPISGGWLPDGAPINWWQTGLSPSSFPKSAIVEACISAYARTIAMCPGAHWRESEGGGRERVTNSALARILQSPNSYQTTSDFMLSTVRDLYGDGNAFALALRNDRYEIDELHLMRASLCRPIVAEDGSIFYALAGNEVIARMFGGPNLVVPQRDVLHIRLTPSETRSPYPLVGESPLVSAMLDMATSGAISQQTLTFALNQARPSAVLSTDLVLDRVQAEELRQRWNEQSRDLNQGRTPILTAGLKVIPWTTGGRDAQIAELLKLSDQHVAMAFGVPLEVLGLGDARYANAEALMTQWVASGLGFALAHVEASFDQMFRLTGEPRDYTEFDTSALLRSAFKDRVDALTKGVLGGLYSPNEARAFEGLAPAEYGDEPRLQAQVVPLSAVGKIDPAPAAPAAPVAIAPPARRLSGAELRRGGQNILAAAQRAEAPSPQRARR
jgi:HK97 family phage portal protein